MSKAKKGKKMRVVYVKEKINSTVKAYLGEISKNSPVSLKQEVAWEMLIESALKQFIKSFENGEILFVNDFLKKYGKR